jgi:hypothetical protein
MKGMSRSSLAAFSELWRAYGEGRLERSLDLVDPGCELTMVDGDRTYTGHDGVLSWLGDVRRQWKSLTVSYEGVEEPHDGCVVGTGRIVAASVDGTRTLDGALVCVAEFRDGRLWRGRAFLDRDDGLRYARGRRPSGA